MVDPQKNPEIFNNLSVMVNNVGFLSNAKVLNLPPQDIEKMLKVNLYPVTLLTKYGIISHKS